MLIDKLKKKKFIIYSYIYSNILFKLGLKVSLKIFFQENLRNDKIYYLKIKNYKYKIYLRKKTSDLLSFHQIFIKEDYNLNFKEEAKVILDLGANVGHSIIYFKNKFPNSKIIAVEPDKNNFEIIKKNTESYKDIIIINSAIWDKETYLKIENPNSSPWAFRVIECSKKENDSFKSISINYIMKKYNINTIDILKMDIEGSEKEVFENNYDWIRNTNLIFVEIHENFKKGIKKIIMNRGKENNFKISKKGENFILFK